MTRFSEWVSALSPTNFTELALVLFVGVFVAIVIRESRKARKSHHAEWASMPLADDDQILGGKS